MRQYQVVRYTRATLEDWQPTYAVHHCYDDGSSDPVVVQADSLEALRHLLLEMVATVEDYVLHD